MEKILENKTGSYLTFKIGDEEYGAHVDEVKNILELQEITKVPKAPEYMIGVINLRGIVLPIIDTRIKLGMTPIEFTNNTCIVVMELRTDNDIINVGALVDEVEAVREIITEEINPSPTIGNSYKSDFITGVVKHDDNFIMILDVIKLFTSKELDELKTETQNNN